VASKKRMDEFFRKGGGNNKIKEKEPSQTKKNQLKYDYSSVSWHRFSSSYRSVRLKKASVETMRKGGEYIEKVLQAGRVSREKRGRCPEKRIKKGPWVHQPHNFMEKGAT